MNIVCPRCKGHGYACYMSLTGGHGTCLECGGVGVIKPRTEHTMADDPFPEGMIEEWRGFLSDSCRPVEDIFDTGTLFPLQRKGEMRQMFEVARQYSPRTIMEIGADKGGGLWAWIRSTPTVERVIACEIRGTPYRHAFERAFPNLKFLWIEESSRDQWQLSRVKQFLKVETKAAGSPVLIDAAFFDGDKSYFREDFDAYLPFMADHSVAFMHDVNDPAPSEAYYSVVDEALPEGTFPPGSRQRYVCHVIQDYTDCNEAVDRQKQGILPATAHEAWLRHWHGQSCRVGVIKIDKAMWADADKYRLKDLGK